MCVCVSMHVHMFVCVFGEGGGGGVESMYIQVWAFLKVTGCFAFSLFLNSDVAHLLYKSLRLQLFQKLNVREYRESLNSCDI